MFIYIMIMIFEYKISYNQTCNMKTEYSTYRKRISVYQYC